MTEFPPAPPSGGHTLTVIIWITENGWRACVDAALTLAPRAEVVLLHVTPEDIPGAAHGAYAGLLGRGHAERDPGTQMEALAAASAQSLLDEAERRLHRPCTRAVRRGRAEQEVTAAAAGAGLLIVARDGDPSRLGPHSLGRAGRFVVDHAPCPVLLVWPEGPPPAGALPPPPGPAGRRPPPPHHGPRHR